YRWTAVYNGDANWNSVSSACNAANETSTVSQTASTLTTQASAGGPVGTAVTDTATLAGGTTPTGTITFNLFGPNDATCAGAAVFTNAKTVAGNGNYTSDPFTTTAGGTYRWTALYSGDANNAPVASACNAANESVNIVAQN